MRNGRMGSMDRNELRERNKLIREQLGKFFLDMAKLAFAGVVLVKIASSDPDEEMLSIAITMVFGSMLTVFFAFIGYWILKQ